MPEHGAPVPCAICGAPVPYWERYPHQVCAECERRAVSADGHPVRFFNETLLGTGFVAEVCVGDEWRRVQVDGYEAPCVIDGIPCRAREHRFGGVVVQRTG